MVGADAQLPLPWLAPLLRQTLASQRAHALLLHGPQGVGQFEFALTLAQAWLCEVAEVGADAGTRPCGVCASCRLVQAHAHPDMLVLLPEALQEPLGWAADDEAAAERASKTKAPSKEIRVEAVRAAVNFAQTTSARGRVKVVVLHPAERMNAVSANTLLKTLEEPPGNARFVLSCAAPDALLPTVRSRCQSVPMALPPIEQATAWLAGQGVADPAVMLAAAGGQPQEALAWTQQGIDAALWLRLPALVGQGAATAFAAWPLARTVDALQKLCHDAACIAAGAAPRYFPAASFRGGAEPAALTAWMRELNRVARHAEHPWNAGLMAESLVQQGQRALAGAVGATPRRHSSVHSRP
ncbi:MAG TPA: DNA polymerase III subunit delta' [Burkholderiaceae bacterium]|nr:DNA polymerase III subunit delta' [Burkholderiaceae bacterium]